MGAMSRLHLLATNVIEGRQSVDEAVDQSSFTRDDVEWAVDELRQV